MPERLQNAAAGIPNARVSRAEEYGYCQPYSRRDLSIVEQTCHSNLDTPFLLLSPGVLGRLFYPVSHVLVSIFLVPKVEVVPLGDLTTPF